MKLGLGRGVYLLLIDAVRLVGQMVLLLLLLVISISLLILGGVFVEPIITFVRRRFPDFSYEGDVLLIWGGLVMTAFIMGLLVMYLLLH